MHPDAVILFGHGARDPAWAQPMERLRAAMLAARPEGGVSLAFLEFMTPSLAQALDEAVAAGARTVRIVPVFLAQAGHVRRDVPLILDAARERHPQVRFELAAVLGEAPIVIEAMARAALAADDPP